MQTMRRARKTAITLAFDTQSSRADAIPPKIVELVKLNACFAVKSWRSNDGFLGDGSFQAGIRATELRMGKDVGTSILTGATAERFEIVKWFYIEADDDTGYDAAADIIARAMANLHPAVAGPAAGPGRAGAGGAGSARRHRDRARGRPVGRGEGASRGHPGPAAHAGAGLGALPDDQRAGDPPLPRRPSTGSRCRPPGTSTRWTRPRSATPSPAATPTAAPGRCGMTRRITGRAHCPVGNVVAARRSECSRVDRRPSPVRAWSTAPEHAPVHFTSDFTSAGQRG